MLLKNLQKKFNQILEEIQTYNDKPNPPGGNNCKPVADIGSITGNQCKFLNNPPATDVGSITGNKANFNPPYKQLENQQCQVGINTTSALGPSSPSESQANFTTANQINPPQHNNTPGINHSDIKLLLTPCLPYKKIKSKKINRKYPLFSRFK